MNMKDGVKQRRQEKIKKLIEGQQMAYLPDDHYLEPVHSYDHSFVYMNEADELDPELVWKTNPNPWASWDDNKGSSTPSSASKRTFVKGSEPPSMKDPNFNRSKHTLRKEFIWKFMFAVFVFAAVWGMFRYETEWTLKGQAFVKEALTDELDFAAAAAWYKETFAGAPSFIPIFKDDSKTAVGADGTVKLPIIAPLQDGSLVRTFAELLNGIELAGRSEGQVVAAETGRVLQLTDGAESGSTIIIQHANKRTTVYGKLGHTEVKVNDWVEAGDPIGNLLKAVGTEPSLLYFSVLDNNQFIDPMGVIPID